LVGNPARSGAMFVYTRGAVRKVYKGRYTLTRTRQLVEGWIGEAQMPTNPGDSGAAVVSDQGRGGGGQSATSAPGVNQISTYTDVREVRTFLAQKYTGPDEPRTASEFRARAAYHNGKGNYEKALADASEAIKRGPKDGLAYYERGHAHGLLGDKGRA